jgi:hypothetical protein
MEKISSQKVAAVLSAVPTMLRSLAAERDGLMKKLAGATAKIHDYERRTRINELAKVATEKNITALGETMEEKVASIETALKAGKKLDVMEEAVKMSSPNGQLGNLGDELEPGNGSTQLESYLLGHLG